MKTFLKAGAVSLMNGGYLSQTEGEAPVTHAEFVTAQEQAAYVVRFAEMAKGKTFTATPVVDLAAFTADVQAAIAKDNSGTVKYVKAGDKPVSKLTDELKDEALAFLKFKETEGSSDRINDFLQKFNVLNDFESHGLFFEQGIVKLSRIYTMDEIKAAVTEVIDLVA